MAVVLFQNVSSRWKMPHLIGKVNVYENKRSRETLILSTFSQQKNSLEGKLCGSHMRLLWNWLDEETIYLPYREFKVEICGDKLFLKVIENGLVTQLEVDCG